MNLIDIRASIVAEEEDFAELTFQHKERMAELNTQLEMIEREEDPAAYWKKKFERSQSELQTVKGVSAKEVWDFCKLHPGMPRSYIAEKLKVDADKVSQRLSQLCKEGKMRLHGSKRSAVYQTIGNGPE